MAVGPTSGIGSSFPSDKCLGRIPTELFNFFELGADKFFILMSLTSSSLKY
jgi:hypothetical protein